MQYLEEILSDLQFVAHLREEVYVAVIEQQVDEDHALVSGLQEVTENLSVCEHVHHDSEHLNKKKKNKQEHPQSKFTEVRVAWEVTERCWGFYLFLKSSTKCKPYRYMGKP